MQETLYAAPVATEIASQACYNDATSNLKGCTIYVTLFPCNECAKLIIQSGIKEIVYMSDKHAMDLTTIASKRLFNASGVKLRSFKEMDVEIR